MQTDCLFCRMLAGEVPVDKVYEDDQVFAILDIHPRAPVHVVVIPRQHIGSARELSVDSQALLGRMFLTANQVAESEGIAESGYRLSFNVGPDAGQTILHLHLHVLGGKALGPEA